MLSFVSFRRSELPPLALSVDDHESDVIRRFREEEDHVRASGKWTAIGQPELNIPTSHVYGRPKYPGVSVCININTRG